MLYYAIKIIVSAVLVVAISEIAKRSTAIAVAARFGKVGGRRFAVTRRGLVPAPAVG